MYAIRSYYEIGVEEAIAAWTKTLEPVFPSKTKEKVEKLPWKSFERKDILVAKNKIAKPKVFVPVFPGTNCEYDSMRAFEMAGAEPNSMVFRNLNHSMIEQSISEMVKNIGDSQILMFPGGFSAGDEPDGSGKFRITSYNVCYTKLLRLFYFVLSKQTE